MSAYTSNESMFDEVDRRIRELRRSTYRWVKGAPPRKNQMCAIVDNRNGITNTNRLSVGVQNALNGWIYRTTGRRWQSLIDFNDHPAGAETVDDVIVMLEKFRAEL